MESNLIMDSQWDPGPSGGPQYFSGSGPIIYDKLSINGYRTCSITKTPDVAAHDFYRMLIDVRNKPAIMWGLTIRAVDADSISLVAEFYDTNMAFLRAIESPIQNQVTYEFKQVMAKFPVPVGAAHVRVSIKFGGSVTACTFLAPTAFYS